MAYFTERSDFRYASTGTNRSTPNAEDLIKEVELLKNKCLTPSLSFEEQNIIKDKLRYVQTRSSWIKNNEHQQYIQTEIEALWHSILQTA